MAGFVNHIVLGVIPSMSCYDNLTDRQLRTFLDQKAWECREVVTLDTLDDIVLRGLRTDMTDTNAATRIEKLFVQYTTIL